MSEPLALQYIDGSDEVNPAQGTNTITLISSNVGSTAFLAKVKYYVTTKEKGFRPFIEFGAGINSYHSKIFDVPVLTSQKIKQNSFVFQPEAGFLVWHLHGSVGYLIGGKTPAFTGLNDQGQNIKMESIVLNVLYFNVSWRFDFEKNVKQ